jgi:tRNA uridine 5-carboxymethylaminomethyl modification enzyme
MKRQEFTLGDIPPDLRATAPDDLWEHVSCDSKYEGYVERHRAASRRLQRLDRVIPLDLDPARVPSLRPETREKLAKYRPETLEAAARISGITQADLSILHIYLNRTYLKTTER